MKGQMMQAIRKLSLLLLSLGLVFWLTVAVYAQNGEAAPIAIGDTVNGELTADQLSVHYTLEGSQGDVLLITLTSDVFDAYLRLWDSQGVELITDDDSAGNLGSRIGPYTLPADGSYTIVVDSLGHDATGPYVLKVGTIALRPIEYTQVVEGTLSPESPVAFYGFRGQQGDTVIITASSDAMDTTVSLTREGQSYAEVSNSSGGPGAIAYVGPYTLSETGEYLVNVSTYTTGVTGDFTLSVKRVVPTPLTLGKTAEVELTDDVQVVFYSLEAQAGMVVSIEADSGGQVDTILSINGPDNYEIASDDDGGVSFDPELNNLVLSQPGTHIVVLRAFSSGEVGAINLTATEIELPSLDEGPQRVRLNSKRYQQVLTFTGRRRGSAAGGCG
jgi:hypothetical protein